MIVPKTAFLLGAGLGKRLLPLTEHCPKPLLPLGEKPMICHAMDALIALGIERFIINTHHAADVYAEKFPKKCWRGVPVELVHEPVLLDTGGGLKNIEQYLRPDDENLLVYNGDIFAELDLKNLIAEHAKTQAFGTLLLRTNAKGNVNFDDATGAICDMRDRLKIAGTRRCQFTGIYCISRRFFAEISPVEIESVVEPFLRVIKRGNGELRGVVDDAGFWHDLGTLEEYSTAQKNFKQK